MFDFSDLTDDLCAVIRRYPLLTAISVFIAFVVIFGVKSLLAIAVAIALILGFLVIITGEDKGGDGGDMFGGGPGPFSPI